VTTHRSLPWWPFFPLNHDPSQRPVMSSPGGVALAFFQSLLKVEQPVVAAVSSITHKAEVVAKCIVVFIAMNSFISHNDARRGKKMQRIRQHDEPP